MARKGTARGGRSSGPPDISPRTDTKPASAGPTLVWVSWDSPDGPKSTQGELVELDDSGYVVLRVAGVQTLWIQRTRVFSIATNLQGEADTAMLAEATAAEAAAVIEAAAELTPGDAEIEVNDATTRGTGRLLS
jgi:hypothetical protein